MQFDPLNPHKFQDWSTPMSYVELAGAPPQPWIVPGE
jgi:hypothetical protein